MDEAGPDRPARTIGEQKTEPRGVSVKPGTYKVVVTFGDQTSEKMITVKTDPRLNVSMSNINEVYEMSKALGEMTQITADAVKQLVESKQIAEKFQSDLNILDKETYYESITASKNIIKKIEAIMTIYLGKEDKRQGIVRNPEITISQRIDLANRYVSSRQNGLTSTEVTLIEHVEKAIKNGLNKTNTFFNEDWKAYKIAMENLKISSFKDIKTFNLKD